MSKMINASNKQLDQIHSWGSIMYPFIQLSPWQIYSFFLAGIFFLQSCSISIGPHYSSKEKIAAISINDQVTETSWHSSHLAVNFTFQKNNKSLSLNGNLIFSDSLLASYPVIRYYFLRIHFLNDQEKTIGTAPVLVNYSAYQFAKTSYPIKVIIDLPPGTSHITFGYDGEFSDYGERSPDTQRIDYLP